MGRLDTPGGSYLLCLRLSRTSRQRAVESREEPREFVRQDDLSWVHECECAGEYGWGGCGGGWGDGGGGGGGGGVRGRSGGVVNRGEEGIEKTLGGARDEFEEFIGVDFTGVVADDLELAQGENVLSGERREKPVVVRADNF